MKKTLQAYYALLRAGLWADPGQLSDLPALDDKEWGRVLRMASRSGTMCIVADGVELLGEGAPGSPPERVMQRLLIKKFRLIEKHDTINRALRDTFAMINGMGYQPVLLKGQALATYYANPESRACGDIDIYVGADDIDALVAALTERGITCEEELNDTERHIIFYHGDIVYELHRYSAQMFGGRRDRAYQQWWQQGVQTPQTLYIDADGHPSWQPSTDAVAVRVQRMEQNVLFTFYHVFHHLLGRYRTFKQFCDLARMLYACHGSIDEAELLAHLDEYGLAKPWRVVGCYLHSYLGLPQEYIPGYDDSYMARADKLANMLADSVFYAKIDNNDAPAGRIASKLRSYRDNVRAALQSLPVFPRHTLASLWQDTTLGIRLLFSRANRQGTAEHYLQRVKNEK